VTLAAVHAASVATLRCLTLDDVDIANRRITLHGTTEPIASMTQHALRSWLEHRRDSWPHSPNRHLLISRKSAYGVGPSPASYFTKLRPAGVDLDRIRRDRVLHEAISVGADPLHLALVFNIAHTTAGRYAGFARTLSDDRAE